MIILLVISIFPPLHPRAASEAPIAIFFLDSSLRGFRRFSACPSGPREAKHDAACSTKIDQGRSGFCECTQTAGGKKAAGPITESKADHDGQSVDKDASSFILSPIQS